MGDIGGKCPDVVRPLLQCPGHCYNGSGKLLNLMDTGPLHGLDMRPLAPDDAPGQLHQRLQGTIYGERGENCDEQDHTDYDQRRKEYLNPLRVECFSYVHWRPGKERYTQHPPLMNHRHADKDAHAGAATGRYERRPGLVGDARAEKADISPFKSALHLFPVCHCKTNLPAAAGNHDPFVIQHPYADEGLVLAFPEQGRHAPPRFHRIWIGRRFCGNGRRSHGSNELP